MPMDKSRYPANWSQISYAVRVAACWRCERCGIHQGELTARSKRLGLPWRVVLTVAHIGAAFPDGTPGDKHNKMDVRRENLQALCQACHLREDMQDHVRHAAETRRRKQEQAGQLDLFGGIA